MTYIESVRNDEYFSEMEYFECLTRFYWKTRFLLRETVLDATTRLHPQGKGGPKGTRFPLFDSFWTPETAFSSSETFKIWIQNRSESQK